MKKTKVTAKAKINLGLDVLKKTDSGYHEIRTVLYETDKLKNEIEIEETDEPDGEEESLANKAYILLKRTYNVKKAVKITIKRGIPMSSGLGGESSNAAAVIKGLNDLWKLNLSGEELKELGSKLGMDVPFFIAGGTALGTNFGEKVENLPHLELPLEIVPKSSMDPNKTKHAYEFLDLDLCGKNTEKTDKLIKALQKKDIKEVEKNIHNDFETITPPPKGYHLTGSGPSYFRIV